MTVTEPTRHTPLARPRLAWSYRPSTRRAMFFGVLLSQAAVMLAGVLLVDFWLRREMHLAPRWADRLMGFQLSVSLGVFMMTAAIMYLVARRYRDQIEHTNESLHCEVRRQVAEGLAKRDALIFGLAKLADYRDTDTGAHLERIGQYARLLAEQLRGQHTEIDAAWIHSLVLASSLHDIGKVGIPDRILLKPGRLDPDERSVMETHTLIGADTLIAIREKLGPDPFLDMGVEIALQHHEKWDGTGYPFGIAGHRISLAARIVAMADFYDAVTSERVYKAAMSHEETHDLILSLRASHFDPAVVDAYLACAHRFDELRASAATDAVRHDTTAREHLARQFLAEDGRIRLAA